MEVEGAVEGGGELDEAVQNWLTEIAASRRREKDFRTTGKKVRELYAGDTKDANEFPIIFSNTETMFPSVYSQVPRPVVQYRFKDENPTAQAAAKAAQRILEFQMDTNIEGYETFNDAMRAAVMDGLLPGRGLTSLKYDADVVGGVKQSELICPESRNWDGFGYGYAHKWSEVPFVFYEMDIDKDEATRLFEAAVAGKIDYQAGEAGSDEDGKKRGERDTGLRKTAKIYQIWDRAGGRKIRYISPQYKDGYLKVQDDPHKLTGFFNCPRPLEFVEKTDDMAPTSLYVLYQTQAEELNELTRRIRRITKAIKAKAIYDSELGADLANLLEADDLDMVPADKSSSLAAEKGLQNAIWFWPVEQLIVVLRELYTAREQCKQVIYEITGISDILRGATKASETLGAQQLKSQWGTLRIKPKQAEVQRYARDLLRIMLEIAAQNFSEETWAKMTGLPYLTQAQTAQAQQMMVQGQSLAQSGDAKAAQMVQQAQQMLAAPKWSEVIGVLQDDVQRSYKIDIETNSTLEPEAVEDQKNISDLMIAMGQYMQGIAPLVTEGVMPFQAAQAMLLAIVKRYRFGAEVEEFIKAMKPPAPKDDGSAQKAQAALQEAKGGQQKAEMTATQEKIVGNAKVAQLQQDLNAERLKNEFQKRESDLALRELSLQTDQQVFDLKKAAADREMSSKAEVTNTKLEHKKFVASTEQQKAKDSQTATKQSESKIVQPVADVQRQIAGLVQVNEKQSHEIAELTALVKKPRKRTAVRDKDGRISGSVDEVMQ